MSQYTDRPTNLIHKNFLQWLEGKSVGKISGSGGAHAGQLAK
jgi:hypothetical protein